MSKSKRIGLVGSVESQPSSPSPAIDLYRSAEFLAARRRVESACERWFILSPHYHLVGPGDWLEPYRETMAGLGEAEREAWSDRVLEQLRERLGSLAGLTFELHAGPEFYEHGLAAGLRGAKAQVAIGSEQPVPRAGRSRDVAAPSQAPSETPLPLPLPRVERGRRAARPAPPTIGRIEMPTRVEMPAAERREILDELYGLLEEQAELIGGRWSLPDCSGDDHWPRHGVVFFFEPGELREDGETPRVVRMETHALTPTSKIRLWDRLRSDRGALIGPNPGSGNHRASALRRLVGRALIDRDGFADAAASWGRASGITAEMKELEMPLEVEVSAHVAGMEFIWMAVPELEDRRMIEAGVVSLLSNRDRDPVDPASAEWLGRRAGRVVEATGLWNVDYTDRAPEPGILSLLRRHLDA